MRDAVETGAIVGDQSQSVSASLLSGSEEVASQRMCSTVPSSDACLEDC